MLSNQNTAPDFENFLKLLRLMYKAAPWAAAFLSFRQ